MANMVIPNEGKVLFLDWALAVNPTDTVKVVLYENNYTPVDGSTLGNFTATTMTGGGPITIVPGDWSGSVIVANVAEDSLSVDPTWTNGGVAAKTVYGWLLYNDTQGKALAAQRFTTTRVLQPGDSETLSPFKFKLKSFA